MGHRGKTFGIAILVLSTLTACIPNPDRPQRGYDTPPPYQPRDDQRPYEDRKSVV